jgi:hypothetical protein
MTRWVAAALEQFRAARRRPRHSRLRTSRGWEGPFPLVGHVVVDAAIGEHHGAGQDRWARAFMVRVRNASGRHADAPAAATER